MTPAVKPNISHYANLVTRNVTTWLMDLLSFLYYLKVNTSSKMKRKNICYTGLSISENIMSFEFRKIDRNIKKKAGFTAFNPNNHILNIKNTFNVSKTKSLNVRKTEI